LTARGWQIFQIEPPSWQGTYNLSYVGESFMCSNLVMTYAFAKILTAYLAKGMTVDQRIIRVTVVEEFFYCASKDQDFFPLNRSAGPFELWS